MLQYSDTAHRTSVIVTMLLQFMARMIVIMLAVFLLMLMIMGADIGFMIMRVFVLVKVFMGMLMTMGMRMTLVPMAVFMFVLVHVLMTVQVFVLVFTFHGSAPEKSFTSSALAIWLSANCNSNKIDVNGRESGAI